MFPVDVSMECLILDTLPEACVIPVDEVREIFGTDLSQGEGPLATPMLSLATLGFSGRSGAPARLLLFVRAPQGPYFQFSAKVAQKELQSADLLPLPARPFADSLFSALVVQDEHVVGLMLDVERLLQRAQ